MSVLLRKITGFSGLVHDNMYRFTGWRFLTIGRSLERAMGMASLLARMTDDEAPDGALDFAVEVGDSTLSHRRRYTVRTSRPTVIDLLALDTMNPRSILYQLSELRDQVDLLPGAMVHGEMSDLARAVLRVHTDVAVQTPDEFDADNVDRYAASDIASPVRAAHRNLPEIVPLMLYEIQPEDQMHLRPAAAGRQLLRLMPADWPEGQRLIAGSIDIRPAPAERTDRYDFFGNRATEVIFAQANEEVEFVVRRACRSLRATPTARSLAKAGKACRRDRGRPIAGADVAASLSRRVTAGTAEQRDRRLRARDRRPDRDRAGSGAKRSTSR